MKKIELSEHINNYINTLETESAVLVSAKWGSGKTFYIKNYITCLENSCKDIKPIYFSLKGISDIQLLIKSILLRILINTRTKKKEKLFGILNFFHIHSDSIQKLFQDKVLIHAYRCLSAFSDIMFSSIGESFIQKVFPKNIIIFLDDLERVSCSIKVIDLIAEINTMFIENNIKIVYIADESKLLENNSYREAKEKYIHRTYSFYPDKAAIFKTFSDIYLKNTENYDVYYQMFISAFDDEQPNLRSVKFAFSLYSEILIKFKSWKKKEDYSHPSRLFYSICAFSNFYNQHQLEKNVLVKNSPVMFAFWEAFTNSDKIETESDEERACKEFYDKYKKNNVFYLLSNKFIIDFVYDGYLDEEELKQFLYLKTKNEDPLAKLSNIYKLELSEVKNLFAEIKLNLDKHSYNIYNLNQLYGDFYNRLDFDKSIDKQKIETLIEESIFDKKNEDELNRFFDFAKKNGETEIKFSKDISESIKNQINEKYLMYLTKNNNDEVDDLFRAIQEANLDNDIFSKIDEHKIFSMLEGKGYLEKILTLKNNSISFIIYLLQSKILGLGNACDFYTQEIPSLTKLESIINNNLNEIREKDPLKTELLENLVKVIEATMKHIRDSKNFY